MTAQASDRITYRDQEFSLVGWEGAGLFDPAQHGLKPFQVSTGNWVGYLCTYAVAEDELRLERLEIGFGADDRAASLRGEGPLLFGVRPRLTEQDSYALYENLGQVMAFSGTLTLGADFVWRHVCSHGLPSALEVPRRVGSDLRGRKTPGGVRSFCRHGADA